MIKQKEKTTTRNQKQPGKNKKTEKRRGEGVVVCFYLGQAYNGSH